MNTSTYTSSSQLKTLGELVLEVADVGLEAVTLPHFDGEEVVIFFLASQREAYWVRNASVISLKLWSECGRKE